MTCATGEAARNQGSEISARSGVENQQSREIPAESGIWSRRFARQSNNSEHLRREAEQGLNQGGASLWDGPVNSAHLLLHQKVHFSSIIECNR
ncbi:hypothetical protein MHYP_G00051280 [Metynnis hypsauchen]